jgi:hypothetical protein
MCKKSCGKIKEKYFHQLTKSICNLEIKRAELFLESQKKCKSEHCSLCLCPNGEYKYITDNDKTIYLCKNCMVSVKKTNKPNKTYPEKQCPTCLDLDGYNIIPGITICLCNRCYTGIKSL